MDFYRSPSIDRVAQRRTDPEWLQRALSDRGTRFVPVWRNKNLMDIGEGPRARLLQTAALPERHRSGQHILLGQDEAARAYFALEVGGAEPPAADFGAGDCRFVDLRRFGPLLEAGEAGLLAFARAMTHWHATHRYCGACGAAAPARAAGWLRVCEDPACGRQHFPRTDPAVIVRVVHGDRILLGRQAAWPEGWYSVLAGFVEPGENLENTVRREVFEEAGIRVDQVRYLGSQPWPFPASLMLGFAAEALGDAIDLASDELEDARWFTRRELAAAVEAGEVRLSTEVSISRHLIETWRRNQTHHTSTAGC